MSVRSPSQLTIDFTPGLTERHESLMDCIRECAYTHRNPLKTIAADMDMSQSELSRKLANNPDDPRRLSVEDMVRFVQATGDTTPIQWLVERFMQDDKIKQQRAMAELAKRMPDILALFKQATTGAPV
ncbi:phage regulatory CII family protein [Bordetella petrii]|uniref:phage regulatory CII family protein n=1 Tax=Bordetella petrii TaxID=94624 RepID=UPI00048EB032|nr:phage regulatory CII family protein [Bordetella petrii]